MPDEVGPDHNDISELRRLVRELLERQQEVDQMLGTDPHAAVKDATAWMLDSVVRLAEYITAGSPSRVTPGASLVRLLAALEDRDRGVSNPLLLPVNKLKGNNLLLMAGLLRVEPAVAMELLIRAGRGRDAAAREVA